MDTQYLTYKNEQTLNNYMDTLNNFSLNEMVYLEEEDKYMVYDGDKFVDIPETVKGEGLSMSLYDLNKSIISQLPVKKTQSELSDVRNLINDMSQSNETESYMLLCKDVSYYTIFQKDQIKECDFTTLGGAVIECAQDLGDIVCADRTPDDLAIEI